MSIINYYIIRTFRADVRRKGPRKDPKILQARSLRLWRQIIIIPIRISNYDRLP